MGGESTSERVSPGLVERLYARLGIGYIALVLAWLGFLVLAGGMISVVVAARLLARSFRPPLDLALLVEAGIVVGCGIPFAFIWRDAQPLVSWIRDGRPKGTASDAWQTGVTLIRRALPRCFVLTSVLLIPAVAWVVGHYRLGPGGFPVGWIFTWLGTAVTAAYTFCVGEAMFRPLVEDAASVAPPGGGVRQARGQIRLKVLLALAVTTAFAVLVSQAIGSIGHSPTSRMLGAVVIAVAISLTFTPVFAVADDGRGYDTGAGSASVGVQNMTDRIGARRRADHPVRPGVGHDDLRKRLAEGHGTRGEGGHGAGLRELVARHRQFGVLDLRGRVRWEGNLADSPGQPVALTDVILTGILQGLRSEREARLVERHLRAFPVLHLEDLEDFVLAALLYRTARRAGVTIRKTLDCLIAAPCVRTGAPLLHADPDFDRLATCTELRIWAG